MKSLQNQVLLLSLKTGKAPIDCALLLKASKKSWLDCLTALRHNDFDCEKALAELLNK